MAKAAIRSISLARATARRLCSSVWPPAAERFSLSEEDRPPSPAADRPRFPAAARPRFLAAGRDQSLVRVSSQPLYRRLSALGAYPDRTVAETMDTWLKERRGDVSQYQMMTFVKELRRYKNHSRALELMDWMESRGMLFSPGHHAIRLDLISKVKGIESAESYFSSLPHLAKNQLTYGALLNSYVDSTMAGKALSLYKEMKDLNLISSSLVHTNLMTLYLKLDQPKLIPEIFKEMKEIGIPITSFAYCMLMRSYALMNDLESVERVIQEIKDDLYITNDWSVHSTIASVYISLGIMDKAELALKKTEEVMDKRNREAYHFLITLYGGTGNLTEVKRIWNLMKKEFSKSPNLSYMLMLQSLSKLEDLDSLKSCFDEWELNCATYDARLANIVIGAYLKNEMISEAKELKEKCMGLNEKTFKLFIEYYLKKAQLDLALEWFESAVNWAKEGNNKFKTREEVIKGLVKYFEDLRGSDANYELFCERLKELDFLDSEDKDE